mmetsp:Transcript_77714/g.202303  ORF Transcript_77714/g.202303 Transcript_77714/m.202303 type:complete len:319 (+) Transcript_77714:940-1896(+)
MRHRHPPNPCQQAERCLGRCPMPSTLVGGSRRWTSPCHVSPRPNGQASTPASGRTSPSAQSLLLLLLPSRALPAGAAWRTRPPSACSPSGFRTRRPPGSFAVGEGVAPSPSAAWARPCPKVGRCRGRCPCPAARRGGRPRWRSPFVAWRRPTCPASRPRSDPSFCPTQTCPPDAQCQDRCRTLADPDAKHPRWRSPCSASPRPTDPIYPQCRGRSPRWHEAARHEAATMRRSRQSFSLKRCSCWQELTIAPAGGAAKPAGSSAKTAGSSAKPYPRAAPCRGPRPHSAGHSSERPRSRSPCRAWPRPTDPACPRSLGRT